MENSIEALSVAHPAPYLSPSSDCNLRRVRRRFSVAVDDGSESEQSWIDDAADGDSSSSYDSPHLSFNTLPAPIALSSAFNPFCMSRDSIDQNGPFRMEAMSYSGLDQLFNQDDDLPSPSMLEIINSPLTSPSPVSSLSPTDTESEADTPEPSSHNDQHTQQQNLSFPPSFSMVSMQTSSSDDDSSSSSVSVSSVGSSSKHSASVSVLCTDHWPSEYRAKAHSVLRPSSDGWYDCTMCFIPRADQYSHRTIYIHHDYLRLECSDGGALRGGCHRDLSRAMNDRGLTHRQELESRIEETRALLKNPDQVKGKRKKGNSESIIQQANNRLHMLERLLYALMNADCDIALLHHRDGDRPIIIPARLRKDDCRKTNRLLYHAKIKFANKLENDRPVVEALRIVDCLLKE